MDTKIWGIIGGIALALALLSPLVLGSTKKVKQAFDEAETLYEQQQYEDANEKYNRALEESKKLGAKPDTIVPDFGAYVHYKIAECARQLGRTDMALQYYREVVVNFPNSEYVTNSYVSRGDIYFDRQAYEAASEEYKEALETTDNEAYRVQIRQKYQQALAYISNHDGPDPQPNPPDPLPVVDINFSDLIEATDLRFNKNFEDAAVQYGRFADTYLPREDAIYALYWAGRCYYEAGLFKQSTDAFKWLVDDYAYTPNAIEAYHGLAAVYLKGGTRDADRSLCQLAIQTVDDAAQQYATSRNAFVQETLGLMNEIRREAEMECASTPPPPPPPPKPEEICVNEGREHFREGELEPAAEKARKALSINPDYPPAKRLLEDIKNKYYDRGLRFLDGNHYNYAIEAFEKVINIDSRHKEAYFHLGIAHFNLQMYHAAANAVNEALAIDETYEDALRLWQQISDAMERNP